MTKGIVLASIAGAVGAILWALIAYYLELEIGWAAWGIGGLVGFAMALGAQKEASATTGVIAAVIALLSVVGGKYITAVMIADKVASEYGSIVVTEETVMINIAYEVAAEHEAQGETLQWPAGSSFETAESQADFPQAVWSEAEQYWDSLSQDEKNETIRELQGFMDQGFAQGQSITTNAVFKASFGLFDLLWGFLAVATAFSIGQADEVGT
ncbi:MAG: hypothetical protein H6815_12560 [Phycisphaeraceae bacterium]|nr:hypothetical protein [Phycisphaerales bacterium]MCB9861273.1 hypothetical protein [Phycisphaeraceae bacterium]